MEIKTFRFEKDMRPAVMRWAISNGFVPVFEFMLSHAADVVCGKFGERTSRRIPPLLETVAIELKLHAYSEAIYQAKHNSYFVDRSYVAIPSFRWRIMRDDTKQKFSDAGVGLLGVDNDVHLLIESKSFHGMKRDDVRSRLWRRSRQAVAAYEVKR